MLGGRGRVRDDERFDYTLYFDATDTTFFFAKDLEKPKEKVNPAFLSRLRDVPQWGFDFYKRISAEDGGLLPFRLNWSSNSLSYRANKHTNVQPSRGNTSSNVASNRKILGTHTVTILL